MSLFELLIIGVGLAMDAFAVSTSKGLAIRKLRMAQAALVGLWFGAFQALMPMLGFFVGSRFSEQIKAVDHWVAFVLLLIVGVNMLREGLQKDSATTSVEQQAGAQQMDGSQADGQQVGGAQSAVDPAGEEATNADLSPKTMLVLAIATSVDALAVGISFALLQVRILVAAAIIGVVTFILSFAGVCLGHAVGTRFKKSATILGGVILIGIGIKILLQHLGILA